MKIKKGKGNKVLFVLNLITSIALLGVIIYENIYWEFNLSNVCVFLVMVSNFYSLIEFKK